MEPPAIRTLPTAAPEPLPDPDDPGFGGAFDRCGTARMVLLGEASHGTSEFCRACAAITRRLIGTHGFTIVAVEADRPDAAALDSRLRGLPEHRRNVAAFSRFPRWIWRNREVDDFTGSLRDRGRAMEFADGASTAIGQHDLIRDNVSSRSTGPCEVIRSSRGRGRRGPSVP